MTFTNTQTKLGQAITTNDSGDYAVRTIIEGDQTLENLTLTGDLDAGGGHILNDQTDINQDALGPACSLDGTNDKIAVANNVQVDITTGDFSMYREIYVKDLTSAITLWEKWEDAGDYWYLQIETTGAITFKTAIATVTKGHYTTAVGLVTAGKNIKIGFVSDRDGIKGQFYVNLLPVTTTETTAMAATSITNTGALNFGFDGATAYSEYEDQYGSFWNIAHTAAQVKNVKNIPFKWQYGSQTSLIIGDNSTFASDTGDWTKGSAAVTIPGDGTATWTGATILGMPSILTQGKKYRVDVNISAAATYDWKIWDGSAYIVTGWGTDTGVKSYEFTHASAGDLSFGLTIFDGGTAGALTDVTVYPLGAVALYDQTSISETYWGDIANNNDGAVTGATVLNQPDGMAFKNIILSPVGQDATPKEGELIYNSATNKLNVWTGAAWEVVTSA